MRRNAAAILAVTLVGTACPPTRYLSQGFEQSLETSGSCGGDLFLWAADDADTASMLMRLDVPGALEEAVAAGGTLDIDLDLPGPASLTVYTAGSDGMKRGLCDLHDPLEAIFDQVWAAMGSAHLTVTLDEGATAEAPTGKATVVLEEVTLYLARGGGDDEPIEVRDFTLTDIPLGAAEEGEGE